MESSNDPFVVPFFRRSEFVCKCGCGSHPEYTERQMGFLENVSNFRREVGPLIVTSYVRCPKNAWWWVDSRHTLERADAIDLRSAQLNPLELFRMAIRNLAFTGFGISMEKNFLHLDVDPRRFKIWKYINSSAVSLLRQSLS